MGIVVAWDRYMERAKLNGSKWAVREEYRRIPLACLGGPLCSLSLFWLVSSGADLCAVHLLLLILGE